MCARERERLYINAARPWFYIWVKVLSIPAGIKLARARVCVYQEPSEIENEL